MKVLLTAADTDLGKVFIDELSGISEIRPIGISESASVQGYESVDLLNREAVEKSLKGVSHVVHLLPYVAPYFAGELIEHITKGAQLSKEVSVSRYSKKHLHNCRT